jgi:hypothetical protein
MRVTRYHAPGHWAAEPLFGTGFAPFTGGPINYAREQGFAEIVRRLVALQGAAHVAAAGAAAVVREAA